MPCVTNFEIMLCWQDRLSDSSQLLRCEVISTRPVHYDPDVYCHSHHYLHHRCHLEHHW